MKQLCRERHTTMRCLAEKYNVSVKTIQRDIFELTFLMPLYIKSGRYHGGVYVMDNFTFDRMYMSEEEIQLLVKVKEIAYNELTDRENYLFKYIITVYSRPVLEKNCTYHGRNSLFH